MKCANCEHNDGMVYTSIPPKYRCTITDEFHLGGDYCNVEFAPVKHGRWIDEGLVDGNQNRYCRCSECGKGDTQAISQRVPYCWWCGAKMDGGENG